MKKEEVIYVKIPEGAEYQRVEVAEDGRICIIYTKECVDKKETIKNSCGSIPKPTALIGGTEVYQKDNGLPYWYCTIKRTDEFMHVYFEDLTENDLLYDANGSERKFASEKQKKFKADVLEALKNKPQEGFRWIPVLEPRVNPYEFSEVHFCYDKRSPVDHSYQNAGAWLNDCSLYSTQNGSQMASDATYFLLLLRWLKDGVATLEQIADDSIGMGNFTVDSYKYGGHEFGGLKGFVGNTYKIVRKVKPDRSFFVLLGTDYPNKDETVASCKPVKFSFLNLPAVGLLELTK